MTIDAKNIIVTYRYVIDMPDAKKKLPDLIRDWSQTKFNDIYEGKTLLLVNPILQLSSVPGSLFQIILDIDADLDQAVPFAKHILAMYPGWFTVEYTGKNGLHLNSTFLVYSKQKLSTKQIHTLVYNTIKVRSHLLDWKSSTRNMATVRIGYRKETDKIAFPILKNKLNSGWIKFHAKDKKFTNILTRKELNTYIRRLLIPYTNQMTLNEFVALAKARSYQKNRRQNQ